MYNSNRVALVIALITLIYLSTTVKADILYDKVDGNTYSQRDGKVFSLFNIVTFKNDGCTSSSTLSSGGSGSLNRNGTCFTQSECSSKGGQTAGSCALGFGVCCIFVTSTSGSTITQNCTYIQNPGYPSAYGGTSSVSYTIQKCSSEVCWLRLDFEAFTIQGTGATTEVNGGACLDSFTVTTNTGQSIPTICGQNTGQHMYVDMGELGSDTVTLNFAFSGTSSSRAWEIKATQVQCNARWAPPDGCLQYHTGLTGRLTSFNFIPTADNHLANQDYSVCVRPEAGFCCIQYMVCNDPNSFSLDSGTDADTNNWVSLIDTQCTEDYVGIAGSSSGCNSNLSQNSNQLINKYCGNFLNAMTGAKANAAICDCTAPFKVDIITNALTETPDATTANVVQSRGVCLEYTQIPC